MKKMIKFIGCVFLTLSPIAYAEQCPNWDTIKVNKNLDGSIQVTNIPSGYKLAQIFNASRFTENKPFVISVVQVEAYAKCDRYGQWDPNNVYTTENIQCDYYQDLVDPYGFGIELTKDNSANKYYDVDKHEWTATYRIEDPDKGLCQIGCFSTRTYARGCVFNPK